MGGILAIGWFDASEVDYLHPTHYSVVYRIQYIQFTVYMYIYIDSSALLLDHKELTQVKWPHFLAKSPQAKCKGGLGLGSLRLEDCHRK